MTTTCSPSFRIRLNRELGAGTGALLAPLKLSGDSDLGRVGALVEAEGQHVVGEGKGLEVKQVVGAIVVGENCVTAPEGAAAARSAIADDDLVKSALGDAPEAVGEGAGLDEVLARLGGVEVGRALGDVGVPGDEADDRPFHAPSLDAAPEGRGVGVAELGLEGLDGADAGIVVAGLSGETVAKEKQTPCREVSFGLHLLVAGRNERVLVITEHRVVMPWQEAMADLVGLVPPVLEFRLRAVEEYALLVWDVEGAKVEFADCFGEEGGALEDLDSGDSDSADGLLEKGWVVAGVKGSAELKKVPDLRKLERGLGIPEPLQYALDALVNVAKRSWT